MSAQTVKIDKRGRIELPKKIRELLGLLPETDAVIELTDAGILIKPPKLVATPLTQKIADMDLPVSGWEQMEEEIEQGHLK